MSLISQPVCACLFIGLKYGIFWFGRKEGGSVVGEGEKGGSSVENGGGFLVLLWREVTFQGFCKLSIVSEYFKLHCGPPSQENYCRGWRRQWSTSASWTWCSGSHCQGESREHP